MSLKDKVQTAMVTAMKAKDKDALTALRSIKSKILLAATESGSNGELSEEEELKILAKEVKQRKDSAAIFKEQDRPDLYDKEIAEIQIIEQFLPAQLSDAEVEAKVKAIIASTGASSMKDMGKVMGLASTEMAGVADPKQVSVLVKKLLA